MSGVIERDVSNRFLTGTGATSTTPASLDTFLDNLEKGGSTELMRGVWVKADSGNSTNKILVKENVDATGFPLAASEQIFVKVNDLKKVFVVAVANTPTVWFMGY